MYYAFHCQMKKMRGQLDGWLGAAADNAKARGFDPNVLVESRLAQDQFSFVRQVQAACDTAKLATARLTAKDAPSHPDTETTLDELRARIRSVITYLEGVSEADYAGAATRVITTPR